MNREELAWAAGLFDGEGHTGNAGLNRYPQMEIDQKDREVLDRFHAAVGGLGKIIAYSKPVRLGRGGGTYFRWYAHKEAKAVFDLLAPTLSSRKRAQAEQAFSKYDARDVTEIERIFEMPSQWTFEQPKTRAWVEARLYGKVLNLFGGKTRLNGDIVYNDLDETLPADLRRDATKVALWEDLAGQFDCVIFDPPFSDHQAIVTYGIKRAQRVTHARDVVNLVLKSTGRVVSLGYNSTGMGRKRGFTKEGILLVNHGGSHSDTIVLSERREGAGKD